MSKVHLNLACGTYDRFVPLYSKEVAPAGIDLNFIVYNDTREIFDRTGATQDFDVAEMSSSEFIARRHAGEDSLVAIPVFPSRAFRHGFIFVNRRSGIREPRDLEGKRVGVPLYTQTAALFVRGLLAHDHGVDLSTIRWVQGAMNKPGRHGNPTVMPMRRPVEIEQNQTPHSLSELLARGEIDALIGARIPSAFGQDEAVERLFPNYVELEKDYFRRTRIFPIMHLIAIRSDVYERHPFIATNLYQAMSASKELAHHHMRNSTRLRYMLPWLRRDIDELEDIFDGDPFPYGIEPNRPTLSALVGYMTEQGLIDDPMPLEDIFVPVYER